MLSGLGLESLVADRGFQPDAEGQLQSPLDGRVIATSPEMLASLRQVLDSERPGSWATVVKSAGLSWGRSLAAKLDARLAQMNKPVLSELPLEACLLMLEHHVRRNGFGRLKLDLAHAAEHGVVIATLDNSLFAALMKNLPGFADPLVAGILQGFFEHISGQGLGCGEIECAAHGAAKCTFAITAPERLEAVAALVGVESADVIIDRMCT
jgi:predicted hydrocarbon binding protein